LIRANGAVFIALDGADSEHFLLLNGELLKLALVLLGLLIIILVELHNGDAFLSVLDHLLVKVLGVHGLHI